MVKIKKTKEDLPNQRIKNGSYQTTTTRLKQSKKQHAMQ